MNSCPIEENVLTATVRLNSVKELDIINKTLASARKQQIIAEELARKQQLVVEALASKQHERKQTLKIFFDKTLTNLSFKNITTKESFSGFSCDIGNFRLMFYICRVREQNKQFDQILLETNNPKFNCRIFNNGTNKQLSRNEIETLITNLRFNKPVACYEETFGETKTFMSYLNLERFTVLINHLKKM